jgi:hypothetical protein
VFCILHNIFLGQIDVLQNTTVHDSIKTETHDEPERGSQQPAVEYHAERKCGRITDQL